MKRLLVACLLVLAMAVPVFAQVNINGPETHGALSPIGGANAQAGATAAATGGSVIGSGNSFVVNDVDLSFRPTFNPTNIGINAQKQGQVQGQIQGQEMNNRQIIAPEQKVSFKSPTQFMATPHHAVPELNFGHGKMKDVTRELPNFSIYGIKPLGAEPISAVLDVTANVKFKRLYSKILSIAKGVVDDGNDTREIRYQIVRAEAQKSWTTGGNLGGGSSALSSTGLIGAAGSAGIVPQVGGTKADDLFTIIFVKISK